MTEEMVTVRKTYLERLVADSRQLHHLEAAGVDNWEGYTSIDDEDEEEEDDEPSSSIESTA